MGLAITHCLVIGIFLNLFFLSELCFSKPLQARQPANDSSYDEKRMARIPDRPDGLYDSFFHDLHFQYLDESDYAPVLDAMPVWLFARTEPIYFMDPCYPEGGVSADGKDKNPGTYGKYGTASVNPGADCTNPSEYHGAYSEGKAASLDRKHLFKKHPKVYVGFFSHAAFIDKDTSRKTTAASGGGPIANHEYRYLRFFPGVSERDRALTWKHRSDGCWYIPGRSDIRLYTDIHGESRFWNENAAYIPHLLICAVSGLELRIRLGDASDTLSRVV
ncbi:MAG: hypothetical protein Q9160_004232 [Pyrenula sp. 1 TL-2023]